MASVVVHPGYALAWKTKEEEIQASVSEYAKHAFQEGLNWFSENVVKVAHPEMYQNGKDIHLQKNPDGSLVITQDDDVPPPDGKLLQFPGVAPVSEDSVQEPEASVPEEQPEVPGENPV